MKNSIAALTLLFLACSNILFAQKAKKEKYLDGINYDITIVEENTKKVTKPIVDLIKFKSGKLSSKFLEEKFAFSKGDFTYVIDSTDIENKKTHFNCDMVNELNETLKWDGDIDEDLIEGKMIWLKTDKKTKTDIIKKSYSFSGGIQKKR